MCGIVGIAGAKHLLASQRVRANALHGIAHRGPDMQGEWTDHAVWLGHTRLSILDLSDAGRQPMESADGRFIMVYNGEVYNYAELRDTLSLRDLRSTSDTEILLRAFAARGPQVFRMLNGIFACAIYDRERRTLWLARDRFGVKPLYYIPDAAGVMFASELRSLMVARTDPLRCDRSALHEWLYYGASLGERTLYEGAFKLLPGHYCEFGVDTGEIRTTAYWSPAEFANQPKDSSPLVEKASRVRALLEQAVARQLVSDVPIGVFLSGGIDSGAVTAFAARHYRGRLSTYSVDFDFAVVQSELKKARMLARRYGTDHHELHIAGTDIADVVQKMVEHHGLPFSDAANLPLFLMAGRIGGTTKVVLQGDGGDELFGGYSRYISLRHRTAARIAARIGGALNELTPRSDRYFRRRRYAQALAPDDLADAMALLLTEESVNARPEAIFTESYRRDVIAQDPFVRYRDCQRLFRSEDPVNQMLFVDSMIILPDVFLEKVDRATMAASVEARVPFLDNDLVEYCFRLTGRDKVAHGRKKWLLKRALTDILPSEILHGPKSGFGVPYGDWLRGALAPLFHDQIAVLDSRFPEVLDIQVIRHLHKQHVERRQDRSFLLWKILNFAIWANMQSVGFTL